ncbi:MAG TPA: IclR family transcriptional regulator [Kofleriaceae bacterium]|nr:IclR family transcriptional regulator [Kofleriaceae bacterium]
MTALARGLEVLACFRSGDALLGNGELAARCRLPKSTVSRLAQTLERLGYLRYVEPVAKYRLGSATLGLGSAVLSGLGIRQIARPMMQEVADFSEAVVALGVRVATGIIYVEVCRHASAMTLSLDVGSRVPVATTAIGRAYFATAGDGERADLARQLRAADAAGWPQHRRDLAAAVEQHKKLGCCGSFGDWQSDINGIAIGFQPGGSLPAMAINCGGPSFSLSRAFLLAEVRPRLSNVVRRLQETLGHTSDGHAPGDPVTPRRVTPAARTRSRRRA